MSDETPHVMSVNQRATIALVGCLGTLVLGVAAIIGVYWLLSLRSCSEEEFAVLEGFPHYGGRQIKPGFDEWSGGCSVEYATEASKREVLAYYSETLRERGWEVEVLEPEEQVQDSSTSGSARTTEVEDDFPMLIADRGNSDGINYVVQFLPSVNASGVPPDKNRVDVSVNDQRF